MRKSRKLRAGFIGCGSIARIKHFPAAMATGAIDCVAFYDIAEQNAETLLDMSQNPDARIYHTADELFNDASIDMVYICAPNKFHAPLAVRALESRKHVICEKPMACTYEEAMRMHRAALSNQRVLYIAYQNRFTDDALYAKRLTEEGAFGEIYYAKAYAVRSMGVPTWGSFTDKEMQGGGALIDVGTHSIDLVLHVTGNYEPMYVSGMTYQKIAKRGSEANQWGAWDRETIDTEDSAFAMIVMKNKMTITVDAAWAMYTSDERMSSFSLYGDRSGIEMRGGLFLINEVGGAMCKATPRLTRPMGPMAPKGSTESIPVREANAYVESILHNEWDRVNGREALVVTKIIDGIYESALTGRPVMLDS